MRNEWLTPSTLLLTLKKNTDESKLFSFQPGQYAAISFKHRKRPTAARCFSIVSSPTEQSILQFSMRSKGRYTRALADLKEGDEVKVRGPFGGFVLEDAHGSETVMLAGGIGVTPLISMIRFATDTNLNLKISLIYSCSTQDDVPFAEELIDLEKHNPNLQIFFVIGDGPIDKFANQKVIAGRINAGIIDNVIGNKYPNKTFFVCGPPPFMRGMSAILKDKQVTDNRIITEAFSQGPNRQTGKVRSWPFNIYVLGAAGLALGSFVVMVSDLMKTLPPSTIINSATNTKLRSSGNSRQSDLDAMINELPEISTTAPVTDAVSKAQQESISTPNTQTQTTPTTTKKATPRASSPATTTTPAPSQTSTPTPKCTTTQSGVTTCI